MVASAPKKRLRWSAFTLAVHPTGMFKYRKSLRRNAKQPRRKLQKQEQKPADATHDAIGGNDDNIEEEPLTDSIQVVVQSDGEISEGGSRISRSEWVISIKEKLERAREDDAAILWSKLCIYKVPHYLRKGDDDKAIVPQIVSLGPYHHGKEHLSQMERHKWRALRHVLNRTAHDIEKYLSSVRKDEERARSCYEGPIHLNSDEFVEMMVLDGCFVLELMRGFDEGFKKLGYLGNDPIFAMRSLTFSIQRDMIMLENQLPLFILDRLLGLQLNNPGQTGLVAKLAVRFFDSLLEPLLEGDPPPEHGSLHCLEVFRRSLLRKEPKSDEPVPISDRNQLESSLGQATTSDPPPDLGSRHCLEAFRRILLLTESKPDEPVPKGDRSQLQSFLGQATSSDPPPDLGSLHCLEVIRTILLRTETTRDTRLGLNECSPNRHAADERRQQLIHCATELKEAGIKFKKRKTRRIWDIKFKNGVLSIPRLLIHGDTRSLFLNLIAFEQCHFDYSNVITAYALFMDNLINSSEDVAILHYCGIIEHSLGSDTEVAELFNGLTQEVFFDFNDTYLHQVSAGVNSYYNQKWHAWKATLRHKHLNNPWAIISVVAAAVLLLLTSGQTFYSIYAYYKPRH